MARTTEMSVGLLSIGGMPEQVVGGLPTRGGLPWERLRARVAMMPDLYRPLSEGCCRVCRGPVGAGYARCFQCSRHAEAGNRMLADAVVPVSYAVRGTTFAHDLWRYKDWRQSTLAMRTSLAALLLVFLYEHGQCVWRAAQMPVPDRLAVVPSGYGRQGMHPLLRLMTPYLRLQQVRLTLNPGRQGRDFDMSRFAADDSVAGANVLMLDDTWVSGSSATSAAAALKASGAVRVAVVVLGRHLNTADPRATDLLARLESVRYDPAKCTICDNRAIV